MVQTRKRAIAACLQSPALLSLIAFIAVVAVGLVLVKWVSPWIAAVNGLRGQARAEELARSRTTLVAILGGGLAVVAAIYAGFTFRLSREGHITDRMTHAIDQLGHDSVDVRVGAIYALERVAHESHADHGPIMEILAAFISRSRPLDISLSDAAEADIGAIRSFRHQKDVQAALSVLAVRRNVDRDPPPPWKIEIMDADLPGARLNRAKLANAALSRSRLDRAYFVRADLRRATLNFALLRGARMEAADLRGATLWGADLTDASLDGVTFDAETVWPHGFSPFPETGPGTLT
jgi:hypothetical protein